MERRLATWRAIRIVVRWLLTGVVLVGGIGLAAHTSAEPVALTIAQLVGYPEQYAGMEVVFEGALTRASKLSLNLNPSADTLILTDPSGAQVVVLTYFNWRRVPIGTRVTVRGTFYMVPMDSGRPLQFVVPVPGGLKRSAAPSAAPAERSSSGAASVTGEAGDFPFPEYLKHIIRRVEARWTTQAPHSKPDQVPTVVVEILRDGSITHPTLEKSSGSPVHDQAALRALMDASPFPPLPAGWPDQTLRITFKFAAPPSER